MTEEDARLALLLAELNAVQNQIRSHDDRIFQIKGWCVTSSLAVGGFAVAYHRPELLAVGAGAVVGFYLINCQFRYYWHLVDRHNRALQSYLRRVGTMKVIQDAGDWDIVGTAVIPRNENITGGRFYKYGRRIAGEALLPNTFAIYLFILVCLGLEAIFIS